MSSLEVSVYGGGKRGYGVPVKAMQGVYTFGIFQKSLNMRGFLRHATCSTCLHLREETKQEIQAKIKSNKKTTIPAVPRQREDISQNREAAAAAAAAAHKVTKVV